MYLLLCSGMIYHYIIALLIFGKGIMSRAEDPPSRIAGQHRAALLLPRLRIQKILFFLHSQHPHTVGHSRITGGISQKDPAVPFNYSWSFVDPETHSFPVIVRSGQQNLNRLQFPRRLHLADIKVGNLSAHSHLFRPDVIPPSSALKHSAVQRKISERKLVLLCSLHFPFLLPYPQKRIILYALQHIWPDIPLVLRISPGEIEIPFPVQTVQLRGPNMGAHRPLVMLFPYRYLFCTGKSLQSIRMAQHDPIIGRHGRSKIIAAIRMSIYVWIRPLQNPRLIPFHIIHKFSPIPVPSLRFMDPSPGRVSGPHYMLP